MPVPFFQIQEAVSEAEASLPDMLTVIPAGTGSHRTQEALQAVIGTSVLAVRREDMQCETKLSLIFNWRRYSGVLHHHTARIQLCIASSQVLPSVPIRARAYCSRRGSKETLFFTPSGD